MSDGRWQSYVATLLATCFALLSTLTAQEPDFSQELPRIPPTEPAKAIETFQVKEGYKIELVASEPHVASPVAICWDEHCRMFVVEMRGYSEHRDEKLGRVRMLTYGEMGRKYEKSVVFADELLWPTAIHPWDGGVFVADAPDILYLKDTDGDGKADVRKRVYTGFGTQNVQGLLNTFLWGLDNRIHGSASSNGGEITIVDKPDVKPISVRGRDFSFDPRKLADFRPESGGAQHGMTFNDFGHKFVCSNSDHCQQVMYEDRYVARNPLFAPPPARVSIAADGPQAEVFRISPVEPWRIVRTRLRVTGAVPGIIEGGGRAAGYFTGATGITMVRGSAFTGDPMYGMVVIGDVGSNLIHRKKLTLDGVQYTANRVDKESEFVASKDNWFRPAQFANGPDGGLYVIDVYREVIEHPATLPPAIKKHLDLDSGRDRGRIWRIAPERYGFATTGFEGRAPTALIGHSYPWTRETAARLIYEQQSEFTERLLAEFVQWDDKKYKKPGPIHGRIHSLYALAGTGKLNEEALLLAMSSKAAPVREHAVRLSEKLLADSPKLRDQLLEMTSDEDAFVRYQLAFTLGEMPGEERIEPLVRLLERDGQNRWIRFACLTSLREDVGRLLVRLLGNEHFRRRESSRETLNVLAVLAGREKKTADLATLLKTLADMPQSEQLTVLVMLEGLQTGLKTHNLTLQKVYSGEDADPAAQLIRKAIAGAVEICSDTQRSDSDRSLAVRGLSLASFNEVQERLVQFLGPQAPRPLQIAAMESLGEFSDPRVASLLLEAWPSLAPATRRMALDVLVSRPEWTKQMLAAVADKTVPASEIDRAAIELLKKHSNAEIREQSAKLFDSTALARRAEVVEQYRPVLEKSGEAGRGKELFTKNCAACHKIGSEGHELGPNLAAMKNRGAEAILLNVLDPNREVNPQYLNYVLATTDGRTLTGVIAAESAASVTLKRADGQGSEVLRAEIEELRSTGLSLMPEGMEKQLDHQAMADVIAYLLSLK